MKKNGSIPSVNAGPLKELDVTNCRSHSDFVKLIEELKKKKIIIYGAGKIGGRVCRFFSRFQIPVSFFWDIKADLIREVERIPVYKPDFASIAAAHRDQYVVIVTIFSENVCQMIHDNLIAAGYHNTLADRTFLDSLLHFECQQNVKENRFNFDIKTCYFCPVSKDREQRCDIFNDYIRNNFVQGNQKLDAADRLIVPSLGLLVSNRCTLTCKGCNHLREYYKPSDNIDIPCERIFEDLDKLLQAVDLIYTLVIVGGESFLHKDIAKIIEHVLHLPKIGIIHIITNGTVAQKDEGIFKLLSNNRIIVEISGYHDRIPRKLQENVQAFIRQLEKHKVNYRYTQQMQWFDFGKFEDREYSREELYHVYSTCCFISNDIFDGKLHKCSRSVFGNYLGKIPDFKSDYVDIRKTSKEDLRSKLKDFFEKQYADVCRYCSGTSTDTIEAGQQAIRNNQ